MPTKRSIGLDEAISLLLDVHTRPDDLVGFTVQIGAAPTDAYHGENYAAAWGELVERRKRYREAHSINNNSLTIGAGCGPKRWPTR